MSRQKRAVAATRGIAATTVAESLALAAVAWGALAFGAVYPWAYWPLAAACLAAGSTAWFAARTVPMGRGDIAFPMAVSAVAVAILVQLVPLPVSLLRLVSPATDGLLRVFDPTYAIGLTKWHALSIVPGDTWRALGLYASFATLLLGMVRVLSLTGARRLVESLAIVAFLLALVGIVQKPLYSGAIYGFWGPESPGSVSVFGPFVNRNHFAGWMLMALPLAFALVGVGLQRGWHGVKPAWRFRLLWLSSPDASRLVLLSGAATVMALSLVMTMSRSGMAALALALVLTGWSIVRGLPGLTRKMAGVVYLMVLVATVVSWVGTDAIVARFAAGNWSEFNDRRGAWIDALSVVADFPVAGTGLNTYDAASLFYQRHDLQQHYGQSHNDYLQLAAEGGLLLVLPIGVCLLLFAREVWRRLKEDRLSSSAWWLRRGAVTALVAVALQETVDFSLQMPGNAVLFAVVCAIALHRTPTDRGRGVPASPQPFRPTLVVVNAAPRLSPV
jgi:O-antigen ligase